MWGVWVDLELRQLLPPGGFGLADCLAPSGSYAPCFGYVASQNVPYEKPLRYSYRYLMSSSARLGNGYFHEPSFSFQKLSLL